MDFPDEQVRIFSFLHSAVFLMAVGQDCSCWNKQDSWEKPKSFSNPDPLFKGSCCTALRWRTFKWKIYEDLSDVPVTFLLIIQQLFQMTEYCKLISIKSKWKYISLRVSCFAVSQVSLVCCHVLWFIFPKRSLAARYLNTFTTRIEVKCLKLAKGVKGDQVTKT